MVKWKINSKFTYDFPRKTYEKGERYVNKIVWAGTAFSAEKQLRETFPTSGYNHARQIRGSGQGPRFGGLISSAFKWTFRWTRSRWIRI